MEKSLKSAQQSLLLFIYFSWPPSYTLLSALFSLLSLAGDDS